MREVICRRCGKKFFPAALHIYKTYKGYYCSWHCYNHRKDKGGNRNDLPDLRIKDTNN